MLEACVCLTRSPANCVYYLGMRSYYKGLSPLIATDFVYNKFSNPFYTYHTYIALNLSLKTLFKTLLY